MIEIFVIILALVVNQIFGYILVTKFEANYPELYKKYGSPFSFFSAMDHIDFWYVFILGGLYKDEFDHKDYKYANNFRVSFLGTAVVIVVSIYTGW